jgi:hypothetical protein
MTSRKMLGDIATTKKNSCKYHTIPSMASTTKDDPMQIDNTRFKPLTKQEK